MKLTCDKCGDIPYALIDGYPVGDRLLEGVMFKVSVNRGKLKVEPSDDAKTYMEKLNTKKWCKEVLDFVVESDGDMQCPTCEDGWVEIETKTPKKVRQPLLINASSKPGQLKMVPFNSVAAKTVMANWLAEEKRREKKT